LPLGPKQTEKGWTEQNACQHFGHNLRLPKPLGNHSHDATCHENNGDLSKEMDSQFNILHRS
jgi:hypothetical protein